MEENAVEYKKDISYLAFQLYILIAGLFFIFMLFPSPNGLSFILFPWLFLIFGFIPFEYIRSRITYIKIDDENIYVQYYKHFKRRDYVVNKDAIKSFKTEIKEYGDIKIYINLNNGEKYNFSSLCEDLIPTWCTSYYMDMYEFLENNKSQIPNYESKVVHGIFNHLKIIGMIWFLSICLASIGIDSLFRNIQLQNDRILYQPKREVQIYVNEKMNTDSSRIDKTLSE